MKLFTIFLLLIFAVQLNAQGEFPTIHQRESEYYRSHPERIGSNIVPSKAQPQTILRKGESLNGIVYGFHPYWMNGAEVNYDFSLLTHLAYFSGDVDAATGNFTSTHSWSSAAVVTKAKQHGVKVHFTITQFSDHTILFNSYPSKMNLIKNIIAQINVRGADGCNVDVEGTSGFSLALADSFRSFIKVLGDSLHAHGKELCVELPAVDWSSGWFVFGPAFFTYVGNSADQYFLMAYDYWWSGSSTAGPVAPLRSSQVTTSWHALRSINTYLDKGCPPKKLIAGFPYYGLDWPTVSAAPMSAATANANSRTYTVVKNNYIDTIPLSRQFWSSTYSTRYYSYVSGGTWRQTWYDDSLSLSMKYDSIRLLNIAGTGMWALGYDGAEKELWNALRRAFVTSVNVKSELPALFELSHNFPNPFNPVTELRFSVRTTGNASVKVYTLLGEETASLFNGIADQGREYRVQFDATGLPSGIYFCRLESEGRTRIRRMILLK
ncbi:MAG: T9SS type A sorting domain-containing protein [Bacteroidetes bacterium]|nr:T9SS type A sorting domain-containing protein [Bacteroidota bacterium]